MIARLFILFLILLLAPAAGAQTRVAPPSREAIHLSFAPVVKKAAPAVVNIFSRRVVRTAQGPATLFDDPFFQRFFGHQFTFGMPRERVEQSLGSGVILDPSGLIVTNRHVIKDAQEILVVLADRQQFRAQVVLSDKRADLAVLKIDGHGMKLPVLQLGDSDALEVGDLVLAIGDPFGVGQTVTSGIVSGLARSLGANDFRSFIQTDAAINPGNSGGALVDLDGKLVGINTAIFSQSGGSVGIGFAIPSSIVRTVLEAAKHGGKVVRPWLGASGQTVTAEIARSLDLPRPEGVLVKDVMPGSPAARAGIRIGDVILTVDGHEIDDPDGLRFRIATLPIGTTARLALQRGAQRYDVTITATAPPDLPPRRITRLTGRQPLSGATIANLNPAFADQLGLDTTLSGVIVTDIADGSIASQLGIETGDIVVEFNHRSIDDVTQLQGLLSSVAPPWVVTVRRGDKLLTTPPVSP